MTRTLFFLLAFFCLPLVANATPAAEAAYITRLAHAKAAHPATTEKPNLKIESVIVGPDAVVVRAYAAHGFATADLLVEPATLHVFDPPQITQDVHDPRHATLRVGKSDPRQNLARDVMGHALTVTLVTKDGVVEKKVEF